jgi:hypothetical protein
MPVESNVMIDWDSWTSWFKTEPWKKIGALFFAVLAVVVVWYAIHSWGSPIDQTRYPVFMDSETGKLYHLEIKQGMATSPATSPDTGRPTLYQPEACYWNADGSAKTTPTYVILNSQLGKPGPTFCPDCGRLVVLHNPRPNGQPPPPTVADYQRLQREFGRQ